MCGKRRPPLPPVERIPQRTEALSGVQRGNEIILFWPAPLRNASSGSVQSIRRVDVYRVAEKPGAPRPLTEDEFAARATLIGSVSYDEIRNAKGTLTYVDRLELAGEPARLRYAVRYVNAAGQRAAFSNFFLMEPAARVAKPPTLLKTGNEYSETANTLTWDPPATNVDGSTPVNLLGYNVYRLTGGQSDAEAKPLNDQPVSAVRYEDRSFRFGERYAYFVRSVSLGTEGRPVESLNSNMIELAPVDTYAPAPPNLAPPGPAPGRLALFWAANTEPDIAGYLIYRSSEATEPRRWTLLTPEIYTRTTYTDANVETGKTYYYYVVAVDTAGNKSGPSETVSETVP